ncbi:MAG: magnesium/cobalt transporter CorA [Chitinophagales bacterium]|nr:magnesium/cobalt transporter CorA [Chitinophagales bacterium]
MRIRKRKAYRRRQAEKKIGMPPGNLVYVGDEREAPVRITVIDFDEKHFNEKVYFSAEECFQYKNSLTNTWINVAGIYKTEIVEKIGKYYGVSSLVLEDVVNTDSRPKVDDDKEYVFIILKMLTYDKVQHCLKIEQISMILGKNFVISFQEDEKDLFDKLRERLHDPESRIRKMGSDYLCYTLMDKIVDEYFLIIESVGEELEKMEEEVAMEPSQQFLKRYNDLKQDSIFLRKSVWPLREVVNYLLRSEVAQVKPETLPYFRDLYDHIVQVIDATETYRDLFSDIMDVYLSTLSLRMNEVVKVLTIISTIFIPLTFIAGVYGMNFRFMPELNWKYGYAFAWGLMLSVAAIMVLYFKKKKWF